MCETGWWWYGIHGTCLRRGAVEVEEVEWRRCEVYEVYVLCR